MNKVNIYVPCTATNTSSIESLKSFIQNLSQIGKQHNQIELRLDTIKNIHQDIKHENIKKIFAHIKQLEKKSNSQIKIIATCRQQQYGGDFSGDTNQQQQILQQANNLGANYIDIDLDIFKQITISNQKAKIVISYHNFHQTPSDLKLRETQEQMQSTNADIIKIAVMNQNQDDAKRIYTLLTNQHSKDNKTTKPQIIIGMGEAGKITRVVAPLLGSYLTFATINNNSNSADGQIEISKLKLLYRQLDQII